MFVIREKLYFTKRDIIKQLEEVNDENSIGRVSYTSHYAPLPPCIKKRLNSLEKTYRAEIYLLCITNRATAILIINLFPADFTE